MKLNSAFLIGRLGKKGKGALLSLLLTAALLAAFVPFLGVFSAHAATGNGSFDDVQVSIQTSSTLPDYYSVSAYNTTGGLVASYQSQYPAAGFELPSGAYIFTATASQQQTGPYPVILANSTGVAKGSSGNEVVQPIKCCPAPAMCCYVYTPPAVEYGYASQQVSGPTSLTILTKPVNQTSTSILTIKVSFPNGTAASDAYVSAEVLGDSSGWAYGSPTVSMSNNSNSHGIVTLVTPNAPVIVSASASVPIVLPYNQSTIQVTVGGVKVNVTAYWEPNQVSFTGQALIVPPQTSAAIVLQYQPQSLYPGPIAYSATQTATASAAASSGSPGSITQTESAEQLPGLQQPATESQSGTSIGGVSLLAGVAIAVSIAALGVALFAVRARPKPTA